MVLSHFNNLCAQKNETPHFLTATPSKISIRNKVLKDCEYLLLAAPFTSSMNCEMLVDSSRNVTMLAARLIGSAICYIHKSEICLARIAILRSPPLFAGKTTTFANLPMTLHAAQSLLASNGHTTSYRSLTTCFARAYDR